MFQPGLPGTTLRLRNVARRRILRALVNLTLCAAVCITTSAQGPTPGQNVNMVSGTTWPYGDPFLERQNEPSLAVSTRNALHLLAGANDYRTVDLNLLESEPGEINTCPSGASPCPGTAEPWVGQYISTDGGARWQSTLLPGFPQDVSPQGMSSPLHGFTTASDPVVRAGTNGLFYYAGIAFNRGTNNGVVFVARFMDLNNKENGNVAGDSFPIRYINTGVVARGNSTHFLDKPWIAVDIPRSGRTCTLSVPQAGGNVAQNVPAGNVYVAYASIATVNGVTTSTIYFSRSLDCGQSWSTPIALSRGYALSQGATIQIDPETGIVYVCWRTFDDGTTQPKDSIVVAASLDGGHNFFPGLPVVTLPPFNTNTPNAPAFFEQGTTKASFRSAAYPAMAVADSGYPFVPGPVYFAWSQRGVGPNAAARIMMLAIPGNLMISPGGITLPTPFPVDNGPITDDAGNTFTQGHQYGPSMTYIEGKLMLVYYDQRLDHTLGEDQPSLSNGFFVPNPATGKFYTESRQLEGELASANGNNYAAVFTPFISDADPPLTLRRHTIDVTLAQSDGGWGVPTFTYSRVSQYDFGVFLSDSNGTEFHQLKVNPPGLPMFQRGMVPFMGDYIDIVGQMFVPTANGGWAFNNPRVNHSSPVHYAAWTSNQDVIPPLNGDWTQYFPITSGTSVYNGTATPACQPGTGFEGDRNQNVYQSRITQGLLVSSPQNSKPLSTTVQRAFVVLVQNFTNVQRNFQLLIANQPPGSFAIAGGTTGGYASFQQALPNQPSLPNPLPAPVTLHTLTIAAHSGASSTVFALSSNPTASITVNANEVDQNGKIVTGGLSSFILLNADGTVPALTNPDNAPQNTNITGVEIYDPGISGPGISGANANATSITSPGISGPGISGSTCGGPGISGPGISGPGISGTGCTSPGISGPGISGPGISGPGISGTAVVSAGLTGTNVPAPGISGSAVSDASYEVSNTGNTTAGYNVALIGCDTAPCSTTPLQLVLSQIYLTPGTDGQCNLIQVQQDITLSNNAHPVFTPASQLGSPGISGSAASDAAFSLEPGDMALITLRGNVDVPTMKTIVTQVAPAVIPEGIDTNSTATTPPVVTPLFITTAALPEGVASTPYSATVGAIGGTPPYTWTITAGSLPSGAGDNPPLTLNASTGAITGTPGFPGPFPFTVQVTDSAAPRNVSTRQLSITIVSPLVVTTTLLGEAVGGQAYNQTLQASGGTPPYTWSLSSGPLPGAVTLSSTGVLTGTPTAAGTFPITVQVTDASSPALTTASQTLTLTVLASTGNITFVQQPSQTVARAVMPPVMAQVTDSTGAVVPGATVTIAIGNNPSGGVLSGTTTAVSSTAGIATFSNLGINAPGAGYTLIASVTGVGGTASNAFPILPAGSVYVTDQNSVSVSVIDAGTNTVVANIPSGPAGGAPFRMAITPNGAFAYVAFFRPNAVSAISTATDTISATIPVGNTPYGIAVTPDGNFVYVTYSDAANPLTAPGAVAVISTATNTVVNTITVGISPEGVAIAPNGAFAYVSNAESNTVSVINTATAAVIATVPVGPTPEGIAITPDSSLVYVDSLDSNTVFVINTASNSVVATVTIGNHPSGIAVTPDGSSVYAVNSVDNTVSVLAVATNSVIATIPVANNPRGVAITPNGAFAYVTNFGSNTVSVISTASNSVVATITGLVGPFDVAIIPATPPPAPPANLAVVLTAPPVTLTWTANTSGSVVGYNVYRATTSVGPYTKIASGITGTTFQDTSAAGGCGGTFYYVVTAVGPGNKESVFSNQVAFTLLC